MNLPPFFDRIDPLILHDPLAVVLGASSDGQMRYTYQDAVKLAGHSCPTTAGAFLMLQRGLEMLYPDSLPVRGELHVAFRQRGDEEAVGVIAAIVSMVTGASDERGFKGLAGNFSRNGLLEFAAPVPMTLRLTRNDTGAWVDIGYDPSCIPPDAAMAPLMQKVIGRTASQEEEQAFGLFWQERVRRILLEDTETEGLITLKKGS